MERMRQAIVVDHRFGAFAIPCSNFAIKKESTAARTSVTSLAA
jgi:hypothetical protein